MKELPVMTIGKKTYYVDLRLNQLRNIKNPDDSIDIGPDFWFIAALKFKRQNKI